MATYSTRMGLTKPAGGEPRQVTAINNNSDLLDKFMPCILVNDGVTPPTGDLYDGALVKERNSGIIWEARKNGGGTYDKVYVRYPFLLVAADTGNPNQSNGTTFLGATAMTWQSGKNSSAANISGGKVVIPIKGIYSVWCKTAFASNGAGDRSVSLEVNLTNLVGYDFEATSAGSSSGGQAWHGDITASFLFNAGDVLTVTAWQNSGAPLNRPYSRLRIALIEPVQ